MRQRARPRVRGSRAAALLCALACGCGSLAPAPPRPTVTTPEVAPRQGQLDLAIVPRPTGDAVLLSLWLDAGTRDGPTPRVAAVAALLAARAVGPGAGGVAHPDGIELTIPCTRDGLPRCMVALERGLSLRTPRPRAVTDAAAELEAGRRRRLASDPGAMADLLALRAALGEAADAMVPLGADDDAAVDAEAVTEFLRQHFGESRGLLIAAGNLPIEALQQAVAPHFGGRVTASERRTARGLATPGDAEAAPRVEVAPDMAARGSIAIVSGDTRTALSLAARLRDELDGRGDVGGHVTPVRGGAVGLLRVHDRDPARVAATVAWVAREPEGRDEFARGARLDGVWEASRALGLRWVASDADGSGAERSAALGLGFTLAPAATDGSARRDRALQRARELQKRLASRLSAPPPQLTDDAAKIEHDDRVSGTLDSGVRVEIARERGPVAGIGIRFEGGPAEEPPTSHGRSTLLAELAAHHCDGLSREALVARLRALDAQLLPHVDRHGWGVVLQLPAERVVAGLRLAVRCALSPSLLPTHVADAAARIRRAQGDGTEARMRQAAASLVAPAAPGQVAPHGSPTALPSLGPADLQASLTETAVARRMQVGVVSPRPAPEVARWLARRLAGLEPGKPRQPPAPAAAPTDPPPSSGVEQLVLWRGPPAQGAGAGARAFARVAARVLAAAGLAAVWHDGGADDGGSWAAVGVVAEPAQQADVGQRVASAFDRGSPPDMAAAVATVHAREALQQSRTAAAGSASRRAMALLWHPPAAAENACLEVARKLWSSPPSVHRVP